MNHDNDNNTISSEEKYWMVYHLGPNIDWTTTHFHCAYNQDSYANPFDVVEYYIRENKIVTINNDIDIHIYERIVTRIRAAETLKEGFHYKIITEDDFGHEKIFTIKTKITRIQ